jgi:CheY-like chemotaxis protein
MMGSRRRILVADDNERLQRAVKRAAELGQFEVVAATKGAEVLPLAVQTNPDAIVLDVAFPDADGRDVLAQLKADPKTAAIPVIVWSGRREASSDRRIALDLGAEDYLEKVDADALIRKVERVLLRFK